MGFMGLKGNGVYPTTGTQKRPEPHFNSDDTTSSEGRVWGSEKCLILGYPEGDDSERGEVRFRI